MIGSMHDPHHKEAGKQPDDLYELVSRNKRGDLLAVFTGPMDQDKWLALKLLPKCSRRFEIQLPNGYRLKFGEHKNILKTNPIRYSDYVRAAYQRYYSGDE